MAYDEVYRSFLTLQSLGICHGLLEFITELNKILAQMAQDARMERQYTLLLNIRNAAIDTVKDAQKRDASAFQKREILGNYVNKILNAPNLLSESEKVNLKNAFTKCVTAGKNVDNEITFENLIKSCNLNQQKEAEILKAYQDTLMDSNTKSKNFSVLQIDVDTENSAVIVGTVEGLMRERGIPGIGFYDQSGSGKSFLHVFDMQSAVYAKALLENEMCRRAMCNIRSEASLQAIGLVTHQKVYVYDGLTKAEAGKFYEMAYGKGVPVFVNEIYGKYSIQFLEKGRIYAEKLLAEAIAYTSGYSKEAKMDVESERIQSVREEISSFLSDISVSGSNSPDNLGYIIDTVSSQEGHRIIIRKDGVTEVDKGGNEKRILKSDNPSFYEDRIRNLIDNFSKDFIFIPGSKAEQFGLYSENFHITNELRNYINDYKTLPDGAFKPDKESLRNAAIERRFMTWAIKNSPASTAADIYDDIKEHLTQRLQDYKKYELSLIDKQLAAAGRVEGGIEKGKEILGKKKESLSKDIERFVENKTALKLHIVESAKELNLREFVPVTAKEATLLSSEIINIPNIDNALRLVKEKNRQIIEDFESSTEGKLQEAVSLSQKRSSETYFIEPQKDNKEYDIPDAEIEEYNR